MAVAGPIGLSAAQVSGILEALQEPAVLLRDDLVVVAANEAYKAAHGLGRERLTIGLTCHELSHQCTVPQHVGEHCPARRCLALGCVQRVTHDHHGADGPHRDLTTFRPIEAGGGRAYCLQLLRPAHHDGPTELDAAGGSPEFVRMLSRLERVAPSDTPVLLLGESGTGKDLAAQAIHRKSRRSSGSFVPLDCSGVPEGLFESELFGHERGAFTGAVQTKRGLLEAAENGTLFLDEVGEIPLSQQVKLLRVLETGRYRRVGGLEERQASFRLVCATHRDLRGMVEQGAFRRDLYYRISIFPIRLPSLRERIADLPALASHLLRRLDPASPARLHPHTLAVLARHPFPGNVRELLNILQHGRLLAEGGLILPEHLPDDCLRSVPPVGAPDPAAVTGEPGVVPLDEMVRRYVWWAARKTSGDRRELARRLGVSERTLYRKLAGQQASGPTGASVAGEP